MNLLQWCVVAALAAIASCSSVSKNQTDALYFLYNATNGDSWIWNRTFEQTIISHTFNFANLSGIPWNFSVPDPDPCSSPPHNWDGVNCTCGASLECNIVELYLPAHNLTGTIPPELTGLTFLQRLNLSINNISGTIPEVFQSMTTLTSLALSWNKLTGPIPSWFDRLPLLDSIIISRNTFTGTVPSSIYSIPSLTIFQASVNHITGTLSAEWAQLPHLRALALAVNNISGTFPEELCSLSNIQLLDLGWNNLTSTIPACVGQLESMTDLLLGGNRFTGTIPSELSSCRNLQTLILLRNRLVGGLPTFLPSLPNISVVFFDHNYLTGTIPDNIGNCTGLIAFHMADNSIHGTVPQSFRNLRNLSFLSLGFNHLTGSLAGIFDQAVGIRYFTVGHNAFVGTVPTFAGNSLYYYNVWNNLLEGTIPAALFTYPNISSIGVTMNTLSGTIPLPRGPLHSSVTTLPYNYISVDSNLLSGSIPIGDNPMDHLLELFGNNNYLSGSIPDSVGNLSQMVQLDLLSNVITGTLPQSMMYLSNLQQLYLSNNLLGGSLNHFSLPPNSTEQYKLFALDISHNQFTGELPNFFAALPLLSILAASTNCFTGTVSSSFCDGTHLNSLILDGVSTARACRIQNFPGTGLTGFRLKHRLQGTLPTCLFSMPSLKSLHLGGNGLEGTLPDLHSLPSNLSVVYLAHNRLTGTIPLAFQEKPMHMLDLSYNGFRGSICDNFTAINSSGSLSLQVNFLSGDLTSTLDNVGTIDILDGNLFWCSFSRDNLPKNDHNSDTYACGSQIIESSIIQWAVTVGLILLLGLLWAYRESRALRLALPTYLTILWERYKRNNKLLRSDFTATQQLYLPKTSRPFNMDAADACSHHGREGRMPPHIGTLGPHAGEKNTFHDNDIDDDEEEEEGHIDPRNMPRMDEHTTHRHTFELEDPRTSLHVSRDTQLSASFNFSFAKSFATAAAPFTKQASIALVMEFYEDIRSLFLMAALFSLLIFFPVNVWLTDNYGTHTYSYAWRVASTLLSGKEPAWILAVLFALLFSGSISFIRYCLRKYPYRKTEFTGWLRSVRSVRAAGRLMVIVLLDFSLMFAIDFTYYLSVSKYGIQSLLSIQILTSTLKLVWNEYILWALVPIAKGTIGDTLPFNRATSAQQGVELNTMAGPRSRAFTTRLRSTAISMIQLINDYSYDHSDVRALTTMILLNTLVVPAVALALISPNCFLHAFVSQKTVSTNYEVYDCVLYADIRGHHGCVHWTTYAGVSSYDPPFFYDYQCSSVVYTTYCPVFVIMFLSAGIIIPSINVACHLLYCQLPVENTFRRTYLDWWLSLRMKPPVATIRPDTASTAAPMDAKPPSSQRSISSLLAGVVNPLSSSIAATPTASSSATSSENSSSSSNNNNNSTNHHDAGDASVGASNESIGGNQDANELSERQHSRQNCQAPHQQSTRVLERERFVVQVVSMYGIVITYGVVFPPLAVIGFISILCLTHVEQYFLGRLLEAADRLQMLWYRDEIKSECYRIFDVFHVAITLVYHFMPFAIGALLFDTMAFDESKEYGAAIVVSFIALTLFFAVAYELLVVRFGQRMHQEVEQLLTNPTGILPTRPSRLTTSVDNPISRASVLSRSAASLSSPLASQETPTLPVLSTDSRNVAVRPLAPRPLSAPGNKDGTIHTEEMHSTQNPDAGHDSEAKQED